MPAVAIQRAESYSLAVQLRAAHHAQLHATHVCPSQPPHTAHQPAQHNVWANTLASPSLFHGPLAEPHIITSACGGLRRPKCLLADGSDPLCPSAPPPRLTRPGVLTQNHGMRRLLPLNSTRGLSCHVRHPASSFSASFVPEWRPRPRPRPSPRNSTQSLFTTLHGQPSSPLHHRLIAASPPNSLMTSFARPMS
jgi:hypothetical protein